MRDLWRSRTSLVWALLVAATLLSWVLGHGAGVNDAKAAGVAILVLTFIKVRFVILEFMEIRSAPIWMCAVGEGWIVLLCALLIGLFIGGSR